MSDIWFQEDLFHNGDVSEISSKGQKVNVSGSVRVHIPRTRILSKTEKNRMAVANPNFQYLLVRLGCEFDPRINDGREKNLSFESANFQVYIHSNEMDGLRVYNLAPVEYDKGHPGNVKLKLEPSLTLISGASGSLGGIEADLSVGRVEPVVRGFTGKNERQPYWNLESHKEFPLYGLRHFWLTLEAPSSLQECYISCRAEGYLSTPLGKLFLRPAQKEVEHRPRYKIAFS
jgi:hypothetical protein